MTYTWKPYNSIVWTSAAVILLLLSCAAVKSSASEAHLAVTVIDPSDKISWGSDRWTEYFQDTYRSGFEGVILSWTARNGHSLFPVKEGYKLFYDRGTDDVVGLLLGLADQAGMEVYLGLDATVKTYEVYNDNFDGQLERCTFLMDKLNESYAHHESMKGFLIPQQGTGLPGRQEAEFIRGIAKHSHNSSTPRPVLVRVHKPAYQRIGLLGNPALVGIRQYFDLLRADYGYVQESIGSSEFHRTWTGAWTRTLVPEGGPDVILFSDGLGSMKSFPALTRFHLEELKKIAWRARSELWPVVELYSLARQETDRDPAAAHPISFELLKDAVEMESDYADRLAAYSFDHMDPSSSFDTAERSELHRQYIDYVSEKMPAYLEGRQKLKRPAVTSVPSEGATNRNILFEKALRIEEIIHSRHDREGQIITYRYMPYHLDHPRGAWQEDACWLTGIYTAAESLRYAVTGSGEALAYARRGWRALHTMTNVTPVPGVVVRTFTRSLHGYSPGEGHRKRWHRDPEREMYYIADISRDQLSGYFMGVAAYFDHVAGPEEKETIRRDVRLVMDLIVENDMKAIEFDGKPTTYGDLSKSPLLALDFLLVAHHITGDKKYRESYMELVERRYLMNAAETSATTFNHFFEHFDDSAYYHALQYETDPELLNRLVKGLDFLYTRASLHGNGHLLFDVAAYRPWSDAAAKGLSELYDFDPEMLYAGQWAVLPQDDETEKFIPLSRRRPMEYQWCWYPGIPFTQGGVDTEFAGVGYLLSYWMGRYHGVIH